MPTFPKPRPRAMDRLARAKADQAALRAWARAVKARAGYRCEVCGGTRLGLEAHHIVRRSQSRRLRYDLANGACLCLRCHREADQHILRIYGRDDRQRVIWERVD